MSMFTLAISYLTTSNLPWFMDLTFQVSGYCSLQRRTLLPSPVTSTTGHCFRFGSASSFFLELFLHSSPVAYWARTDLGSSSFRVIFFFFSPFHSVHWVLKAKILKWFAIPFSRGPRFVRTLRHDPVALHRMAHSSVVATRSGKQTHSEGQCRWWSALYYTGGPKEESPLSQGPRPTFVITLHTLSVLLKPTSPNSLNPAWKVFKGDTVRL